MVINLEWAATQEEFHSQSSFAILLSIFYLHFVTISSAFTMKPLSNFSTMDLLYNVLFKTS